MIAAGNDSSSSSDGDGEAATLRGPDILGQAAGTYRKRWGPAGRGVYDFGPSHVPGLQLLPEQSVALPNLPVKSGIGMKLRPPHLGPNSCVPPPAPEPLVLQPPTTRTELIDHDAIRVRHTYMVLNKVVYDCLELPQPLPPESIDLSDGGIVAVPGGEGSRSASERGSGPNRPSCTTLMMDSIASESSINSAQEKDRDTQGSLKSSLASRQGSVQSVNHGNAPALPPIPGAARRIGSASEVDRPLSGRTTEQQANRRASAGPDVQTCAEDRGSAGSSVSVGGGYSRRFDLWPDLPAWYSVQGPTDTTLVFESRFESGNLRRAIQVYPFEYDLILRPDINTRGHTQWFFFSISNTRADTTYKFNIINLCKDDSLYNAGMQPLVHSACLMASQQIGWHRSGERIAYFRNSIKQKRRKRYSTLSFTINSQFTHDVIHIAHCYPYTYTNLQHHLAALETDVVRKQYIQRSTLCSSLAGNAVDLLSITDNWAKPDALKKRKGVIISSRVHPGETNASWMMKGLLDFLTGPSQLAQQLRSSFIFKVIPMLNPDGVIVGNYRCSLAGVDLNRVWNDPNPKLHPTIHATKNLLKTFSQEREVVLFCDLHGHSRKHDIFVYGCEKKSKDCHAMYPGYPVPGSLGGNPSMPIRLQDKLLPLLLYHSAPDLFSYRYCAFKVQKSKGGTGRVVGFRELGLVNSFTLEASFAGASTGKLAGHHFNTHNLETMGAALLSALADYWDQAQYGMSDLLSELEFLHPPGADPTRHWIRTADGQLVEVEADGDAADDGVSTDSDDESSDDELIKERKAARAQARAAAALAAQQAMLENLAGLQGNSKKKERSKKNAKLRKMLQEQATKANEGVMACLPLLGGKDLDEPLAISSAGGASVPARGAAYSKVPTPASLEYARARGIYKGESLTWANSPDSMNLANSARARPADLMSSMEALQTLEAYAATDKARDTSSMLALLNQAMYTHQTPGKDVPGLDGRSTGRQGEALLQGMLASPGNGMRPSSRLGEPMGSDSLHALHPGALGGFRPRSGRLPGLNPDDVDDSGIGPSAGGVLPAPPLPPGFAPPSLDIFTPSSSFKSRQQPGRCKSAHWSSQLQLGVTDPLRTALLDAKAGGAAADEVAVDSPTSTALDRVRARSKSGAWGLESQAIQQLIAIEAESVRRASTPLIGSRAKSAAGAPGQEVASGAAGSGLKSVAWLRAQQQQEQQLVPDSTM